MVFESEGICVQVRIPTYAILFFIIFFMMVERCAAAQASAKRERRRAGMNAANSYYSDVLTFTSERHLLDTLVFNSDLSPLL